MDIFSKVKSLDLPLGKYVIFGSGPMEAHGLRQTGSDIDILVTSQLYAELKQQGWPERVDSDGDAFLEQDGFEVTSTWNFGHYNPTPEAIISRAEIIQGIPFAPLEDVLSYKRIFDRPKDKKDIKLIERYLASR